MGKRKTEVLSLDQQSNTPTLHYSKLSIKTLFIKDNDQDLLNE